MGKKEMEWIIDDSPIDFSQYDYTDEEWEKLYQERFGIVDDKVNE